MKKIKLGDFSLLAKKYKNRPSYSNEILIEILDEIKKPNKKIQAIDAGAGTGIFSRMLLKKVGNVIAVEPNSAMMKIGKSSSTKKIKWIKASSEKIPLKSNSFDLITMASSFHWVNFKKGIKEFNRLLKPGGAFVAIWNPRDIKGIKYLEDIESYLYNLKPNMKRISSGNSLFTKNLKRKLIETNIFQKVKYFEKKHQINFSKKRYINAWRSVNDIQSKLGDENFQKFLNFVNKKIKNKKNIKANYLNRAWVGIKKL